ncbi:phage antirepressor KilAC domain-containing protein [Actinocorallia sp. API 0066]|uniref:phage antirepressor KilAC domain-containing protein n=1 Tax=Actinocorallia sp. API 0066 TaxID=2896846 RepID=UPI001E518EDB|nr:phage antirepressor KilAC domain-containing protein [Actinocorallia sp. API 0066]MCD0450791.1 phage antirepressor KilAC domain-containing protein [Actinocorallia sp. API 0066]
MSGLAHTSPFDAIRRMDERGEYWTARDLMPLLGYSRWGNFEDRVLSARTAIDLALGEGAGHDHIADTGSMVPIGSGASREVADHRLTRFGAYMVALECDGSKQAVADAKVYFATRARQAEVADAAPAITEGGELDLIETLAAKATRAVQIARTERAARQEAKERLAEAEPKAEAWDVLATADGDVDVAQAAKLLSRDPSIEIGQRRLFRELERLGWIFRSGPDGAWTPKQDRVTSGHLSILPQSHYHPRTGLLVLDPPQVRVTVKGLEALHRRLGGTGRLDAHGRQLSLPA